MNPITPDNQANVARPIIDVPRKPPLPVSAPSGGSVTDAVAPQDPLDLALGELGITDTSPHLTPLTRPPAPRVERRSASVAGATLVLYAITLALIGFWPSRVDAPAAPLLRRITDAIPWMTYARIEFGANILLFVPLGMLLAIILTQRYLILPIAIATTVGIESLQALMLERRAPSVMDIVANVTGACIGLLIVALIEWSRRRRLVES